MHFANSSKNNFAKIGKKCFFAEFTISQDIFKLQQSNIYQTNGNLLRIQQKFASERGDTSQQTFAGNDETVLRYFYPRVAI